MRRRAALGRECTSKVQRYTVNQGHLIERPQICTPLLEVHRIYRQKGRHLRGYAAEMLVNHV